MQMDELLISTGVDSLIRVVHDEKRVSLDEASKKLNISSAIVDGWAQILIQEGLIKKEADGNREVYLWEDRTDAQLDAMIKKASSRLSAIKTICAKASTEWYDAKEEVERCSAGICALTDIFNKKLKNGEVFFPDFRSRKDELSRFQKVSADLALEISMLGGRIRSLEKETNRLGEGLTKSEGPAPAGETGKGIHAEAELTSAEKKIKEKYGSPGIEAYKLIDGQRTAEEIMHKIGATEERVTEMLDFMQKEGLIKLEHTESELNATELQIRIKAQRAELDEARRVVAGLMAQCSSLEKTLRLLAKERGLISLCNPDGKIKPIELLSAIEEKYIKAATAHYDAGRYSDAVEELSKAIDLLPSAQTYELRAHAYFRDMEYKKAVEDANAAIALNENSINGCYIRGLARASLGEYDTAIEDLTLCIQNAPSNADAYRLRGIAYICAGNRAKAREDLKKAIELNPNDQAAKDKLAQLDKKDEISTARKNEQMIDPEILVIQSKTSLADVGGMDALKGLLTLEVGRITDEEKGALAEKYGLSSTGGILLYGPPGVGKSYIAEAIAGEFKCKMLRVNVADILSKWYGSTERNMAEVFSYARKNQPIVLFFDEMDSLGASRADIMDATMRGAINQFLSEMDISWKNKERVLVIGATNSPWCLDSALLRSGRFNKTLFVAPPDKESRERIFAIHISKIELKEDIDCKKLAELTEGFSGANIEFACREAALQKYSESLSAKKEMRVSSSGIENVIKEMKTGKTDVEKWNDVIRKYGVDAESFPDLISVFKAKDSSVGSVPMFR